MEVILIAATTADGYIGRHGADKSTSWTSPEDKRFYVSQIMNSDVIVMGSASFGTFTRHPKNTNWVIYDHNPEEFINPNPEKITARATKAKPHDLIQEFKELNYKRVALCGGKSIYSMFLTAGLIDRLFLTIEPIIFGYGIPLFDQPMERKLHLEQTHDLNGQTKVMEYTVMT